jgi:hypothetical protein
MFSLKAVRWYALLLLLLPTACITSKTMTVGATASLLEDVARSANRQSNLELIRQGMPAYLMLIDGMAEAVPNNERLLITAAQTYASYASAFIPDTDKEYARVLFTRARQYALRALEQIGVKNPVASSFDDFETRIKALGKKDVPYLFWAGSCWANWINLNMRSMEARAELPRVQLLMTRVLELDEAFYYGGAHIFMGIMDASKPPIAGGDLNRARDHFLKAIELGKQKFLMARVYYARYYACKALDRRLFVSTLQKVLDTPADIEPDLTLLNTVAHARAEKMLSAADEYF